LQVFNQPQRAGAQGESLMNFITTTLFESLKTPIYMILGLHWFWNGVTGKNSVTAAGYMGLALALMSTHDVVAVKQRRKLTTQQRPILTRGSG
jgi:hypothetical protein